MGKESGGFVFLQKFPRISIEKLKAGIFDSPHIRELIKDPILDEALSEAELSAWQSLKSVVTNFLGNHWSTEYEKEIEDILKSSCRLGAQLHLDNWRFEWRAKWALSPRRSHYGRTLPRSVGCILAQWLMLVLETGCGGCWTLEEVPKKTFLVLFFVFFLVYYGTLWAFCEYISPKFVLFV